MSASATVTRFAKVGSAPWRNGAGATRELLREDDCDGRSFAWRISVADITGDGPFLSFPGVDRVLMLCEGVGLVVVIDGTAHMLRRFDQLAFAGDAHITARRVQGPAVDLNVMTARATTEAAMVVERVDGHTQLQAEPASITVLVPLEGHLRLEAGKANPATGALATFDAVQLTAQATVQIAGRGRLARINLTPRT